MQTGKIVVVGIGPGAEEQMSPRAHRALKEADVVVGYSAYIDLVAHLLEDKTVVSSGMKREVDRCRQVLDHALQGKNTALISSGDAGIYGMAGIMLELVQQAGTEVPVEIIPGITASQAAAAVLGAPLMHDFATISLSDLMTEWSVIEKRLHAAGAGDFVVCLYNPRSKGRPDHILKAQEILLQYKRPETPVGIVRNAAREGETALISRLDRFTDCEIDMFTTVIIGNQATYVHGDRMITPRGYTL